MGKTLRVLLVEDSEDDALLMVKELEHGGYALAFERVETAEAMADALEKQTWDLVIADYSLPQFSAPAALEVLQRVGLDLPFIVVSGTIGEDVAVGCMKAGAHDFFLKGNLTRLPVAIERELREAEGRRERKRTEDVLKASEEGYRLLMGSITDGVQLQDPELRYLLVNDELASMAQMPKEKMLGRTMTDLFPGVEKTMFFKTYKKVLETGEPGVASDEFVFPDGRRRWLEVHAYPAPEGILVIVRDITERRSLEEQLRHAQRLESIGQLAGGVAHDFNGILTGIIGYTQLLLDQVEEDSPICRDLTRVRELTDRAATLTRQLLAFGRRQTLERIVLNINKQVHDSTEMLKRLIGEDIDLVFAPAPDLGNVLVDPVQLAQVLMNFVLNARDAMPKGGKLTIETANVVLGQEYANAHVGVTPGPYVMLAVTDTGCGMDEETQGRVFEPFFTTKESGKGTGLGLATVYGIVKQHGGNIWVYSELGKGTAFKVYLPCVGAEGEAVAVGPRKQAEEARRGTETILLVEDEGAILALVGRVLEQKGYTVLTASSPGEAEKLFEQHGADVALLLSDVILPERSGRELYERLAAGHPTLKVMYVSGYADNAIAHHGVLESGTAFLQKPFSPDALARRVREVLDS